MVTDNQSKSDNSDILESGNLNTINKEESSKVNNTNTELDLTNLSFNRILVTYDDSSKSNKAINYSIYLSKISGAEITILQVIGNIDKLENSSIDVSSKDKIPSQETNSANSFSNSESNGKRYTANVEGSIVRSMEDKVKEIESTGLKNKVSYKIRPGFVVDEIAKETKETRYDLLVISSSHLDSWIKSLFSETRKIISNVDVPVLILH
ncbi:MAG TPA: universal stress protein [Candidatus Nitrosocosmicus sp.]|nr:universal stress protein [Candidatus Nitrosocosmicus sp.]